MSFHRYRISIIAGMSQRFFGRDLKHRNTTHVTKNPKIIELENSKMQWDLQRLKGG